MGQGPYGPGPIWAPGPWAPGPSLLGKHLTKKRTLEKRVQILFFGCFLETKKMRDVRTIILAAVSRRDLGYDIVSENKGFRFYDRGPFMEKFPWSPPLYNFICGYKIDMAKYFHRVGQKFRLTTIPFLQLASFI